MTDAYMWHMTGVDRAAMTGLARTIILWDKTVVIIDGTEPDYKIRMEPTDSQGVAYTMAILATEEAEQRGLTVKTVYGLRGANGGFATSVSKAHRLALLGQRETLLYVVRDIVFMIQEGERLHG